MNDKPQEDPVAAFQTFRGTFKTWDALAREATRFATRLGPDRIISISHGIDAIFVWYWKDAKD